MRVAVGLMLGALFCLAAGAVLLCFYPVVLILQTQKYPRQVRPDEGDCAN